MKDRLPSRGFFKTLFIHLPVAPGVRRALVFLALAACLAAVPMTAQAQAQSTDPEFDLTFTLEPEDGTVDIRLAVDDPANLATLQLAFGNLNRLVGDPHLEGDWEWRDGGQVALADLRETPNAVAEWTANGQVRTHTHEGEGHTSYVGEDFAILRAGQMIPPISYQFQTPAPTFHTAFHVNAPPTWTVEGPWERTGDRSFAIEAPLPRGFLVADDDLDEISLGHDEEAYRILRVEGTQEAEHTEKILLTARSFLGGIYGDIAHQRFIVTGPDPMFRGGLASPDGVFLHATANEAIVAHEMVHAYQSWDGNRGSDATVWLMEGAAEIHGKLLEVASDHETRQGAQDWLEDTHLEAKQEHGVDLRTAVYGSGNERAAYTKGAIVITALNDEIRGATNQEYTLAHVLRYINEETKERGHQPWDEDRFTNQDLQDAIRHVTGFSLQAFFDRYVYERDVPDPGALFPGEASIRILDTNPNPPISNEPFHVRVALANHDTREVTIDHPILIDGTPNGTLKATLRPGQDVETTAPVDPQPRGEYTLQIQDSTHDITIQNPPKPHITLTIVPQTPQTDQNVTAGFTVENHGEAPYNGPTTLTLDGETIRQQDAPVHAGTQRTFAQTLPPLPAGNHTLHATAPNGTIQGQTTFTVTPPEAPPEPDRDADETQEAPHAPLITLLTIGLLAAWRRPSQAR